MGPPAVFLLFERAPKRTAEASDRCESCIEGVSEPSWTFPGTGVLVVSSYDGESDPEEELEDDVLLFWLFEDRRSAIVTACCGFLDFEEDSCSAVLLLTSSASSERSSSTGDRLRASITGGALSIAEGF